MAEFCITFGVVLLGIALLSAVLIILLLRRDKKMQFLQEEGPLKKQYGISRRIGVVFSVLLAIAIVFMLILVLDDIGRALINVSILFGHSRNCVSYAIFGL